MKGKMASFENFVCEEWTTMENNNAGKRYLCPSQYFWNQPDKKRKDTNEMSCNSQRFFAEKFIELIYTMIYVHSPQDRCLCVKFDPLAYSQRLNCSSFHANISLVSTVETLEDNAYVKGKLNLKRLPLQEHLDIRLDDGTGTTGLGWDTN